MKDMTAYDKVRAFQRAMGQSLDVTRLKDFIRRYSGERPDIEFTEEERKEMLALLDLRLKLIEEEYAEATEAQSLENFVKEMADLVYVVLGFFATAGIDFDLVFDEVHRSNMSKLGDDGKPLIREDGKVLKGPNYTPADVTRYL